MNSKRLPVTVQEIEEAESGAVYRVAHQDDGGYTIWVRVREKRLGLALFCADSTNPELVGMPMSHDGLHRNAHVFGQWERLAPVAGTRAKTAGTPG